jgi:hypothetical protein
MQHARLAHAVQLCSARSPVEAQEAKAPGDWRQVRRLISCQLTIREAQLSEAVVRRIHMWDATLILPAQSMASLVQVHWQAAGSMWQRQLCSMHVRADAAGAAPL